MWALGTELEQSGRAEYSLSGTTSPALCYRINAIWTFLPGSGCGCWASWPWFCSTRDLHLHWLWRLLVHLLIPFVCSHTVFLPDPLSWEGRTVDADYLLYDDSRTTHLQTHMQSRTPGLWLASFYFLHVFGCLEVPGFALIMCIIYVLHSKILLP